MVALSSEAKQTPARVIRATMLISVFLLPPLFCQPVLCAENGSSGPSVSKIASGNFTAKNLEANSVSEEAFKSALSEIEKLLENEKNWPDAKQKYADLLDRRLSRIQRKKAQKGAEDLNVKILFSPVLTPDSFLYTVQPGDILFSIAKKNHTTVDLLKKSNRLLSDVIQTGKKLKISKAKFSIRVDKLKNWLFLLADEKVFKRYRVATGKANSTPVGTFTIETKLENPIWYKNGAAIPPGGKDNILGTRWLGFSLEHYGIHGTTLPQTIGTQASEGCVRMFNRDVEELYTIVPLKTQVVITD